MRRFLSCLALLLWAGSSLAFGPFGGDVIDVAPRDGGPLVFCATSRGLFRSQAGAWKRVDAFGAQTINALAMHGDMVLLVSSTNQLSRSLDGGQTWSPPKDGLRSHFGHPPEEMYSVAIDPTEPRTQYLGTDKGFFISRDAGLTWKLSNDDLRVDYPPAAQRAMAILPPAENRPLMYGTPGMGLFRLEGEAWKPVPAKGLPPDVAVNALVASPLDPATLALASRLHGVWLSRDAGLTWAQSRKGEYGVVPTLAFDANGLLAAAFSGEGFVTLRDKIPGKMLYRRDAAAKVMAARPEGGWAVGLRRQGLMALDPMGDDAGLLNAGLDATSVHAFVNGKKPDEVWCGDNNSVFFSPDGGVNWELRNQGLVSSPVSSFLWSGDDLFVGLAGMGVYWWNPAEARWVDRGKRLGTANTIRTLLSTTGGRFYVGTEGGVLYTDNRGSDWVRASAGLPPAAYWSLALTPWSENQLVAAGDRGMYVTKDGGQSWTRQREGEFLEVRYHGEDLWVLQNNRLERHPREGAPQVVLETSRQETLATYLPLGDTVFVGSSKGLSMLRKGKRTEVWTLAPVLSLYVDFNNLLWVGTDGYGAIAFVME